MDAEIARALEHQRAGRLTEAEAIYRVLLASAPDSVPVLHQYGLVELERGSLAEAVSLIGRAHALREGDAVIMSNLGEAYRRQGDLDRAFDFFKRAMESDPGLPVAHLNLGVLMRARGMLREAEHFLLQGIMLFPDMFKAHSELAQLYLHEERYPEAVECLKSVVALKPELNAGHHALGDALASCGETREAIVAYERAIALGHMGAALELAKLKFEMAWEERAMAAYSLLQPKSARVVAVTETSLANWCSANSVELTRMGDMQVLPFDLRPPTVPESFGLGWRSGKAIVPFAYHAFVGDAEVIRPGFSVIAGKRDLIIEGIVSEHLHYPYRDGPVRFNSDDGRMLLDLFEQTAHCQGSAFLLGEGGDRYCWLYENLARLWFVEQNPRLRELPLVVSSELSVGEREMLRIAYGGEPQLICVAPGKSVGVDSLVVSSLLAFADNVSPVAVQFLRRKFSSVPPGTPGRRRLFLSRKACSSRRIANEAALKGLIESNGFEMVEATGLGWLERLRLFEQAEAIIGLDDETMNDLFIVPQGAKVGVIATDGIQNSRPWLVSAQLGHRFRYLLGRPKFDSSTRLEQCDVELDPALLDRFMSEG